MLDLLMMGSVEALHATEFTPDRRNWVRCVRALRDFIALQGSGRSIDGGRLYRHRKAPAGRAGTQAAACGSREPPLIVSPLQKTA
jgi:hypothetical protein